MYNRRLATFLVLVALGMTVAVIRLVQIQLVRGDELAQRAEQSMRYTELLATARGRIFDRPNKPLGRDTLLLALDRPSYDFCMDYRSLDPEWIDRRVARLARRMGITPEQARRQIVDPIEQTLDRAAEIAGVPREQLDTAIQQTVRRVSTWRQLANTRVREEEQSHPIISGLTEPVAVTLRSELPNMAASSVMPSTRRWYPHDDLAPHIIGRVSSVWAEDLRNDPFADDPLRRYLDGEVNGKTGVERMCESILRGARGRRLMRRSGEVLSMEPPQLGRDVHLTIDADLQRALTNLMLRQPQNGAAVIIDIPSGEILALVSTPTYNLNSFSADYRYLSTDELNLPLLNRAVSAYPPGSTIKPAVALAALAERIITPHTSIECLGYLHTPDRFRCGHRYGHGRPLNLPESIIQSCNVYYYKLGEWLGCDRMLDWMRRFGFGRSSGLPNESAGLVPSIQWLYERRGRSVFYRADAWNMAIGQGFLLATPLQIANLMAAIARDGEYVAPRLVKEFPLEQERYSLGLSSQHLQAVQQGLYGVVNHHEGTAYKYARHPEIEICGKTGTAQAPRRRIDTNGDGRHDVVLEGDMAWFTGYAPYNNPRIAFAIFLEYVPSGGGGSQCGPIAQELVTLCRQLGYLP